MDLIHMVSWRLLALAFAAGATGGFSLAAQSAAPVAAPGPGSQPATATLPTYRPPALALVQPAAGGSIPQDRPVVVFRFTPGEPNDPIDTRSFTVRVDGADRSAAFHVSAGEAWGTLADPGDAGFVAGAHQVAARLCSARGACTETTATVMVVPSAAAGTTAPRQESQEHRRKRLIATLLDAVRSLLTP
jgi:hypothetical protein